MAPAAERRNVFPAMADAALGGGVSYEGELFLGMF